MQLLSKPFLFMFDPYHVGPQESTSYDRNNGRVIRRRLINPPSRSWTRNELMELLPLMQMNGLIPSGPTGALTFNSIGYSINGASLETTGVLRNGDEVNGSYFVPLILYYTPGNGLLYYCVVMNNINDGYDAIFRNDTGNVIRYAYHNAILIDVVDIIFNAGTLSVFISAQAVRYENGRSIEMGSLQWTRVPWNGPLVT